MKKVALILAGGKGTRLWPLSRENHPKQFVEFKEGSSLFQLTIKRLLGVFAAQDIFIISHDSYKFTLINQIEFLHGLPLSTKLSLKKNILFEPAPKSTLPAILLSMKYIETHRGFGDDELLYVFPSDHIIEPISEFKKCMLKGEKLAQQEKLVVFGLKPTAAKTGYGYILAKKPCPPGLWVDKFTEKPSPARARKLISQGAFWNAGIFCFGRGVFLRELKLFQPRLFRLHALDIDTFLNKFKSIPALSIDYGIMQRTRRAGLIKFGVRWTDLGSWDSFLQFYGRGEDNLNIGKAQFLNSRNCFSFSPGRLVCMVGLNDIIAVDASDSLLLVKKGQSDKVKELVALLNKNRLGHSKDSSTVYRPWGYYTVLHEAAGYKVKEIGVYPKRSISLQRHRLRSEHWNVVEGKVYVNVDGSLTQVGRNQSVYVPPNRKHRIQNMENKVAKIIEVQIGAYLGEDDITRFNNY